MDDNTRQVVRRLLERQRNTYLDTEDLRLRRAGAVLKLRQVGRRAEVTFKRGIGHRNGISRRLEVTSPLRSGQIRRFLDNRLEIKPVRLAKKIAGSHGLNPRFTLFTDRRRVVLAKAHRQIELDLDTVTLFRGRGTRATYREVELENLNASPRTFQGALAALRRRFKGKLRSSRRPKAEYGFRTI